MSLRSHRSAIRTAFLGALLDARFENDTSGDFASFARLATPIAPVPVLPLLGR
jgi:hypothetical protein